ncbi:Unknown protein [Striga hermonthica]|uniref:Uncharacterized protein n=1 Tax=Striga hermonthica TaxID=68872 RepID=A0A9N7QYT3_STRHE|nr:Unknown protein [Striga hermonthica]
MDNFFGGKDPFDHPFFSQPFGGIFGGKSPFDDPFFSGAFDSPFSSGPFGDRTSSRKQIKIEELNPENEGGYDSSVPKDMPSKEVSLKNMNEYPTGNQSFSFQRVAYGGPEGWYYTSSVGRRTGGDGVFLMEMKEEDRTVGESLHTVSKGIHDKGHSVTTKQFSDGKVDSLQTLHNLQEDELTDFQENWNMSADKVLPGWNDGFNLIENSGFNNGAWDDYFGWGGWPRLSLGDHGNTWDDDAHGSSSDGPSRKIVPVE